MSTVLQERRLPRAAARGWWPWAALLAGLACLYVPTYVGLAHGLWRDDAYAHGPIILAVFAYLVWRRRDVLVDESLAPAPWAGGALLAAGLALYLLGRTQSIALFEVASHIPVVAGVVLLARGFGGLRRLAFPILFLLFVIPLPGFVLEAATGPLKELVSATVAGLLHFLGYPVERSGVVLTVGGHELLVADACSGMNSLVSLFALGLLYTHLAGGRGVARTLLVLAAIVPIAIAANVLRVLGLSLVAVHFGDAAARGFAHDIAGFLVFSVAFMLIVAWDKALGQKSQIPGTDPGFPSGGTAVPAGGKPESVPGFWLGAAGAAMVLAAVAAPGLKPVAVNAPIDLERAIPTSFGDWRVDPDEQPVALAPDVQANLDRLYGQVVARTYVNSAGDRMMLTVAHGGDQSDALKAHRQEVCYRAQGFEIHGLARGSLTAAGRDIPVTRMLALRGDRSEPVTYWFTMGDRVVLGRLERLRVQVANGLAGRIPDGMLVRVSSLSSEPARAFAAQQAFVAAIVAAVPATEASRLVGAAQG
jgi:exosortase B